MKTVFCAVMPMGIDAIKIGHNHHVGESRKFVNVKLVWLNVHGEAIAREESVEKYPLLKKIFHASINEDLYLQIDITDENGRSLDWTFDILYCHDSQFFGVEISGLTESFNAINKKAPKSRVIKNNIVLNNRVATDIYVVNASPLLSEKTDRSGKLDWQMLDNSGQVAFEGSIKLEPRSMGIVRLLDELKKVRSAGVEYLFYTFTATADVNILPLSFHKVEDRFTGCEHSQPPFGYFKGTPDGPQKRTINVLRTIPTLIRNAVL